MSLFKGNKIDNNAINDTIMPSYPVYSTISVGTSVKFPQPFVGKPEKKTWT